MAIFQSSQVTLRVAPQYAESVDLLHYEWARLQNIGALFFAEVMLTRNNFPAPNGDIIFCRAEREFLAVLSKNGIPYGIE